MDDDLTKLVLAGPDPAREMQRIAMTRYEDITTARKFARTWQEIARSLGLAQERHKSLAAAYWRVRRGIEAGRLAVPGKRTVTTAKSATTTTATKAAAPAKAGGGFKDVTPED